MTNLKNIKIIFFSTPKFGANILKELIKHFSIQLVITAPDKKDRKGNKIIPVTKKVALKNNIKVLQPKSLKNNNKIINQTKKIRPDYIVVASYGLIIPKSILNIPKKASLNIHPSLLPKYRGACPIRAAIKNDETKTGVTIIKMDERLDHGPILNQLEIKIPNECQFQKLKKILLQKSKKLIVKTIKNHFNNKITPQPQNHKKASFSYRLCKKDGKIDWSKSAKQIHNLIRAYCVKPGCYSKIHLPESKLNQKTIKIFKTKIIKKQGETGKIFITNKKELAVYCGKYALILKKVQLPSKNIISGKDLYNGHNSIKKAKLK